MTRRLASLCLFGLALGVRGLVAAESPAVYPAVRRPEPRRLGRREQRRRELHGRRRRPARHAARRDGFDRRGRSGNFTLRVEVRFMTDDADSGVFVRAPGPASNIFMRGWPANAYQVQLRDMSRNKTTNPIWIGNLYRHRVAAGRDDVRRRRGDARGQGHDRMAGRRDRGRRRSADGEPERRAGPPRGGHRQSAGLHRHPGRDGRARVPRRSPCASRRRSAGGERIRPVEPREPGEVAVGRAQPQAVLDGERSQMRVRHETRRHPRRVAELPHQRLVPVGRQRHPGRVGAEPFAHLRPGHLRRDRTTHHDRVGRQTNERQE